MKEQKIIIADFDEKVRKCLKEAIEKEEGLKVVATTGSGMELLHLIKTNQPDFVIMDLILPWVDGISVLEQMQKEDSVNPKIFILTKLNNEQMMQTAFSLGICYYMLKPFSVKLVLDRIKSFCNMTDWTIQDSDLKTDLIQKEENVLSKDLERDVLNKISEIGIPHHVRGFRYLETAILLCIEDMNRLNSITKELYPMIAKKYDTTPSRVERGIRHAIEIACSRNRENSESLLDQDELFFLTSSRRPTNSEFIAFVADKIRIKANLTRHK